MDYNKLSTKLQIHKFVSKNPFRIINTEPYCFFFNDFNLDSYSDIFIYEEPGGAALTHGPPLAANSLILTVTGPTEDTCQDLTYRLKPLSVPDTRIIMYEATLNLQIHSKMPKLFMCII